jgi:hypothetical protein
MKNLSPYVQAMEHEKRGEWREAARCYRQAGDQAGGHTFAAMCYQRAQGCISKTPDDPSSKPSEDLTS